ncbi:unnamed protein product, partial [Brassica rapa]
MVRTTIFSFSFSNLTRGNSAPLCLMAQAVLSSRGQRAFSIEERRHGCSAAETWLFSRPSLHIQTDK